MIYYRVLMSSKNVLIIISLLALVGCETLPTEKAPEQKTNTAQSTKPTIATPDGVTITPYDRPEIKRENLQVIVPQQKISKQSFDDGQQLPAYQNLIQKAHAHLQQAQWDEAEQFALQAQRLAPQSAQTFLYLALISNHKNQPANAESLARRGLSYAQSNAMKKQLWLVIFKAGQLQNKTPVIQEAQKQLNTL